MLRRTLATLLCWLFLAPVLPLAAAPSVPICCLRDGSHHCSGMTAASDKEATLRVTNACPYQQQTKPTLQNSVVLPQPLTSHPDSLTADAELAHRVLTLAAPTISPLTRGPPTLL